ncbi:hypothetical protein QAD02_021127 [Eretmocerus hayati]|uniref:Uncharacterized protein n=1 Tax=Eretmocerus hayati TaxID=131215 RepID=A0ACC2PPV8_9HYME|nr:hypothetical protein QAD02_021127 [Eretmocerus hayati]
MSGNTCLVKHLDIFHFMERNSNLPRGELRDELARTIITRFDLTDDPCTSSFIKLRLSQSFFNNYNRKMRAIKNKNKRNFDGFRNIYCAWLEEDFELIINPQPLMQEDVCNNNGRVHQIRDESLADLGIKNSPFRRVQSPQVNRSGLQRKLWKSRS